MEDGVVGKRKLIEGRRTTTEKISYKRLVAKNIPTQRWTLRVPSKAGGRDQKISSGRKNRDDGRELESFIRSSCKRKKK